jgi:hypothetical protein
MKVRVVWRIVVVRRRCFRSGDLLRGRIDFGADPPLDSISEALLILPEIIIIHEPLDFIGLDNENQLEAIAETLGGVEVGDLEPGHGVAFLSKLQAEWGFRTGGQPDVGRLALAEPSHQELAAGVIDDHVLHRPVALVDDLNARLGRLPLTEGDFGPDEEEGGQREEGDPATAQHKSSRFRA